MNCSQLSERRTATNWERPAQPERNFTESTEPQSTDSYRWSTVRFSPGRANARVPVHTVLQGVELAAAPAGKNPRADLNRAQAKSRAC